MLDRLSSDLDRAELSGKASLTHKSVVSNVNHIKIQETSQESHFGIKLHFTFFSHECDESGEKMKNSFHDDKV